MLYICDHIYNTPYRRFFAGWILVQGGRIAAVGEGAVPVDLSAEPRTDFTGKYITPGLVDCHMHIESSMMTPAPFAAAGTSGPLFIASRHTRRQRKVSSSGRAK